ncbi:MAG TPA: GNAT family N-acetyltransferase [Acidimicrobiia bacterium]|nr:GNAT family N-acetyltransferase [Acidimicrobiia bacterium]
MQAILSQAIGHNGPRYAIHPGDLAWWAYHSDPRTEGAVTYWLEEGRGFVVLDANNHEIAAFCVPEVSPMPLLEWGQDQLGPDARVGFVSTLDHALETELAAGGYEVAGTEGPVFTYQITTEDASPIAAPGLELRSLSGEEEADRRRRASHAAFKSTMEPADHLERYLRFMRSPVYEAKHDLVAVTPDGTIAAFMIWWPDASGIAQIEPMGTDPAFQRQGVGQALMRYAFSRMSGEGVTEVRVITDDHRLDAVGFYSSLGFTRIADLRFWRLS